jgi:hypothetical protein
MPSFALLHCFFAKLGYHSSLLWLVTISSCSYGEEWPDDDAAETWRV